MSVSNEGKQFMIEKKDLKAYAEAIGDRLPGAWRVDVDAEVGSIRLHLTGTDRNIGLSGEVWMRGPIAVVAWTPFGLDALPIRYRNHGWTIRVPFGETDTPDAVALMESTVDMLADLRRYDAREQMNRNEREILGECVTAIDHPAARVKGEPDEPRLSIKRHDVNGYLTLRLTEGHDNNRVFLVSGQVPVALGVALGKAMANWTEPTS